MEASAVAAEMDLSPTCSAAVDILVAELELCLEMPSERSGKKTFTAITANNNSCLLQVFRIHHN